MLIVARFVQGLAGGVGIVIAQAAGRDVYSGGALIRFYGRLTVVGGLAAIVGPLLGGLLTAVTDWRGLFVVPRRARRRHPARRAARLPRDAAGRIGARAAGSAQTDARLPAAAVGPRRSSAPSSTRASSYAAAVRLPGRRDVRAAGHLRAVPAAVRARVRAQLGRVHGVRLPRRPRRGAVERARARSSPASRSCGVGRRRAARSRGSRRCRCGSSIVSLLRAGQRRRGHLAAGDHARPRRATRRSPARRRRCWAWSGSASAASPRRWSGSRVRRASCRSASSPSSSVVLVGRRVPRSGRPSPPADARRRPRHPSLADAADP